MRELFRKWADPALLTEKRGQHGQQWATNPGNPQNSAINEKSAKLGNSRATVGNNSGLLPTVAHVLPKSEKSHESQETAESWVFSKPVAHVAHVALENDQVCPAWDAADWLEFYSERAGILEFDGELPRADAEAQALEWCITEWWKQHPAPSESGRCGWCGEVETAGAGVVVPFGTESHGENWLHHRCWQPWHQQRCEVAKSALMAMGVGAPES